MNRLPIFSLAVFLSALAAPAAERVSRAAAGASRGPSLSGNGRFVAFESTARLAAEDTNRRSDVYVFDRTTKTTRLVSDDRGGDQPVISANGRFVAYRSFERGVTRIRVRDLDRGGVPLTASFPLGASSLNRTAELAAISPEGRFVAYVLRPSPNVPESFPDTLQSQIVIADTVARTAAAVDLDPDAGTDVFLAQLGRVAMSADGNTVVFDTTDALAADDANGAADVYRATIAPQKLARLSKAAGVPDAGGATQPVFTLDGNAVFFLAASPLSATDTDGRASLYMSSSADAFAAPVFLPTLAAPRRLAAQAAVGGRFLAWLGAGGRAFVRNLATGIDAALAKAADAPLLAPVLSADDRTVAFATSASNLVPRDTNPGVDVFVSDVKDAPAAHGAPGATVALSSGSAIVAENSVITIGATATPGVGAQHRLLTVEVDGVEQFRTTDAALAPQNFAVMRGVHRVQARAFDDAWIEGRSTAALLIVAPANSTLGITGTTALTRTDSPDGSARFTGTLRIDNRRVTPTAPLRVTVTINATPQKMAADAGDFALVPDRGEVLVAVVDVPAIGPLNSALVNFSGITPATEVIGDGLQGNGWSVLARLRELTGPNFTDVDVATLLVTRARLDENTPVAHTGIAVNGTPSDSAFNPGLIESLTLVGPGSVVEGGRAVFAVTANFSNGSRACVPQWSLTGDDAEAATIDAAGVLTAGVVRRAKTVTVRAEFAGKTATMPVTILPVAPRVSILAADRTLGESGDAGRLRILRSPAGATDLTVNYTLTGKAVNGVDYGPLSGVAVIPARASAVSIDVLPLQDAVFEGEESVIATIAPSPAYRLGAQRSATLRVTDDEPFPDGQPDLALRRGRAMAGSFVVDADAATQTLSAAVRQGVPATFAVSLVNRGTSPRDYTLRGGAAAPGFAVQYLDGAADVTAAVTAGTFTVPQLPPGAARVLRLRITAMSASSAGSSQLCVIEAETAGGPGDVVSVFVERAR